MTHGPVTKRRTEEDNVEPDPYNGLPKPPDGGWGWMVVFASFCIHIVTDGMTYSFGIFYVEFLDYFKEGKGYTAWVASILVGVTLCSGPISSAFVNKYGCRAVTIAGAILGGLSLIASVFAQSVFTLFITIGLGGGLGFGLIYLPAIVSVTMYFEKLRSLATGIAVCGSGFGTFVFAPITEILIKGYGWRGAMLIIAGIVFNCAIFGAMFRPLEHEKPKKVVKLKELEANGFSNGAKNGRIKKRSTCIYLEVTSDDDSSPIQRSNSLGQGLKQNGNADKIIPNGKFLGSDEVARMAMSQPLLNAKGNFEQPMRKTGSGIMYKPDIFYRGSTHNLERIRSKVELESTDSNNYGSLKRTPREKSKMCGCIPCSQETRDTFSEMMDFSLVKDPVFLIFTMSNFLTSIGFNIPYVYLAAQAEVLGISSTRASYLLSIIGIANTVGRIILGYFSDKSYVNRLLVYNLCLTICGVACALSVFCFDFFTLGAYSSVYGFTIGAYVGLTSVILVDLLGLDKLTNAFGILLLFQGIASLVGPPLAGFLYDVTGKYEPGFLLAGGTIGFSGVILFAIPPLQRYLARKKEQEHQVHANGNSLAVA